MSKNNTTPPQITSKAPFPTNIFNLDPAGNRVGAFDQIASAIKEIKKERQKTKHKSEMPEFVGVVLYSQKEPIKASNFLKMHPFKSNFYRELVGEEEASEGAIISCYCYVPEVSGYYPFPNYEVLKNYNTNRKIISNAKAKADERAKAQKEIQKSATQVFVEYSKIVHHPIFHKYIKSGDSEPAQFEYVNLKFAASLPSMYEGTIVSNTSKIWSPA